MPSTESSNTNRQPFLGLPSSQSVSGFPYLRSFLIVIVAILVTSFLSWKHAKTVHKDAPLLTSSYCRSFSGPSFPFVLRSTRVVTDNGIYIVLFCLSKFSSLGTFPASIFVDSAGFISRVVPGLVEDSTWGCLHDVGK